MDETTEMRRAFAKYKELIDRPVYRGKADSTLMKCLLVMFRRHTSFIFELRRLEFANGELGTLVFARPEVTPGVIDENFLEMLQDKLAEMREEFAFALDVLS
jgi:hypothetical protein